MFGFRLIVFILSIFTIPATANSQCVSSNRTNGQLVGYDRVNLVAQGIPGGLLDDFQRGYREWNDNDCNPNGSQFPLFIEGTAGAGRNITVRYNSGFSQENNRRCGSFAGNTIDVYEFARSADGTTVIPCSRADVFQDTITHELGHVLGLRDQTSSSCQGYIMGQVGVTSSGTITDRRL